MKPEVALKYLAHIREKKQQNNEGFTLIELLVVVIIIGVLAAVALPNLLGQVGKAREVEVANGIGAVNRAQQAYHFERGQFASGINVTQANNELGTVVKSQYYTFGNTAVSNTTNAWTASITATPNNATRDGVRAYSGAVTYSNGGYTPFVCRTRTPSPTPPSISAGDTVCPSTSDTVK